MAALASLARAGFIIVLGQNCSPPFAFLMLSPCFKSLSNENVGIQINLVDYDMINNIDCAVYTLDMNMYIMQLTEFKQINQIASGNSVRESGNPGIWEFGNLGILEFGNSGIWEFGNLGIRESGNRGIRESGNSGIWESGNSGIWEFGNLGIRESGNSGIRESWNSGIWEFNNLGIQG